MKHLILNDLGHVVNLGDRYVHHWLLAGLGQHLKEPWCVTCVSSMLDEKDELRGFTNLQNLDLLEALEDADLLLIFGGSVFFVDRIDPLPDPDTIQCPIAIWGGVQNPDILIDPPERRAKMEHLLDSIAIWFYRFQSEWEFIHGAYPAPYATRAGADLLFTYPLVTTQRKRLGVVCDTHSEELFPGTVESLSYLAERFDGEKVALYGQPNDPVPEGFHRTEFAFADITCCSHIVTGRLHIGILALTQGIPTVFLSNGGMKLKWLAAEFGLDDWVIDLCEVGPDAVGPLAWELLANEWPRERVLATVQEFADDARRTTADLARMIENGV